MKTALLLAIITLSGVLGDVYLAKGMKQVGEIRTLRLRALLCVGRKIVSNVAFLLGLFYLIVSFLMFLVVLSWADLSFVFPATALVYVVTTLAAKFILRETVSLPRWVGTVLVCLGVGLVSFP